MTRSVGNAPSTPPHSVVEAAVGTESEQLGTLIRRSASGDLAAFMELYDATCPRVYGLALRVLRSPQLAEDVALATYLELWWTSARYNSQRRSPVVWVLVTTLHRLLNHLGPFGDGTNTRRSPAPMPTLDQYARNHVRARASEVDEIRDALAWLRPGQLEALNRACRQGDVAETVHLTTVLTTPVQAGVPAHPRAAIRAHLQPIGDGTDEGS